MTSRVRRPRAERFTLPLPARVRPRGHATWRDADIVNVSRTGILLVLGAAFPPAETIDVEFTAAPSLLHVADVRCVGQIVREATDARGRVVLAAEFDEQL